MPIKGNGGSPWYSCNRRRRRGKLYARRQSQNGESRSRCLFDGVPTVTPRQLLPAAPQHAHQTHGHPAAGCDQPTRLPHRRVPASTTGRACPNVCTSYRSCDWTSTLSLPARPWVFQPWCHPHPPTFSPVSLGHSLKRLRERERERGVPVLALTGTRNAEREQVSPPQAPIFWTLKDTFFKS